MLKRKLFSGNSAHGRADKLADRHHPVIDDRTARTRLIFGIDMKLSGIRVRCGARSGLHVLAAILLVLATSGNLGASEPEPKSGGTLEFAVTVEPGNYDCHANTSFAFLHPIAPHYSTLLKFDAANYPDVVGDLAESWSISPDRLTYSFNLRPNVLFHDGSKFSSADVKASYERIIHPPPGVISARQVDYAAISRIDTPDPRTVVFHLKWPEAAMLANFASPWNCIYSAAKLAADPNFPKTNVLGTGPFVFVEHAKGSHWSGRRWEKYFRSGRPYLDGYKADFMAPGAVLKAYESGTILAEFRGVSPKQRDELTEVLKDRVTVSESPWLSNLSVVFNAKRAPFNDARVRRALSLAIDRWGAAERQQSATFLKYVGGLMRPGSAWAMPESELAALPGFSHDIAAARAEARRLLMEAGVPDLKLTLLVRGIPMPHFAGADLLAESWHEVGVTTTQQRLDIWEWQKIIDRGDFDVALDFIGDFYDDPTFQLTKYVSPDLSPINFSGAQDRFLDALFIGQAMTTDQRERVKILRAFEQHALTEAYTVPLLWWNRIVITSSKLKGWHITPSHFIGQDLADVSLEQ
jgi:peptide/nickel transport system substrate-binding protein